MALLSGSQRLTFKHPVFHNDRHFMAYRPHNRTRTLHPAGDPSIHVDAGRS